MKTISVIVPIYNGEKYLERCIVSLLQQVNFNIKEVEILLINDGSKDGSFQIAKKYEQNNPGVVKLIDQTNVGVSETRNKGIDLARGRYIMFVDQDDFVDQDFYVTLYSCVIKNDLDAVYSGMKRPDINGKIITKDVYEDKSFSKYMCTSVWAKIHKTEFLITNNIRFRKNKHGEDVVFSFEELQKTNKIKVINYCGYNWFYNPESVSNTKQVGLYDENIDSILDTENQLINLDTRRSKVNEYFITMIIAYYLFFAGKIAKPEQFVEATSILMNNLKKTYPKFYKNKYIWLSPAGVLPVFSIGLKIFILLYRTHLLPLFAKVYCRGRQHNG